MSNIINTRADLDALAVSDPESHAAFLGQLRASLVTRYDATEYPDGYDRTLLPEAPGYIAPAYEVRDTPETAASFGFTPEELVLASFALGPVDPEDDTENQVQTP